MDGRIYNFRIFRAMVEQLKIWKSIKVKKLLEDFFEENFSKANVEKNIGNKVVTQSWELKNSSTTKHIKELNIKLFNKARKQASSGISEINLWELFDLSDVETLVDIGANKLRRINELAGKYSHIKSLIGVDVIPQSYKFSYPERSRYIMLKGKNVELGIKNNSVDLVNIQYVFHHFDSNEDINRMLMESYRILKPGGRLLLWEESFVRGLDSQQISELVIENNLLGIETDLDLTKRFYGLSDDEKLEFIIVNDWLINVNNKHMQWTGLYKTWEEWVVMLESLDVKKLEGSRDTKVKNQKSKCGFRLLNQYNLGLRRNAMIKQGVHVVGEFLKNY